MTRTFALLAASLALTGCFEVSQDISINGDGSGRLKFDLGIDENISMLAALGGGSANLIDTSAVEQRLKRSENVISYTVDSKVVDGLKRTIVDCKVKDVAVGIGPLNDLASDEGQDKLNALPKRSPDTCW